jgi:hypothetical protein
MDSEAIKADLAILESLVKSGAPQPMLHALLNKLATKLGIATSEVLSSISSSELKWYTTPVDPALTQPGQEEQLQG